MRILKFVATGCIGLAVNLGIYAGLTALQVPYLVGSDLAFLAALVVGFLLQKYWTFNDQSKKEAGAQFLLYTAVALINLIINTGIVYLLVGHVGIDYLIAQTAGAAVVAAVSYVIYQKYIFISRGE